MAFISGNTPHSKSWIDKDPEEKKSNTYQSMIHRSRQKSGSKKGKKHSGERDQESKPSRKRNYYGKQREKIDENKERIREPKHPSRYDSDE